MAWQDELNTAYADYTGRKKFSYDPETDAGYRQYRQAYMQQGKQAMQDTIGQASALTGGYGNSYAATAGAQAYQQYAAQAAQAIPTFQGMAMQQYQMEGDDLLNRYNMAKDGRDFEHQQQREAVADDQWQQSFDYQKERDAVADSQWQKDYDATYDRWKQEFERTKQRDAVSDAQWQKSFDADYEKWKAQFDYQQSRDAVSDSQWNRTFGYQQSRDAVSDSQWQTQMDYQKSRDAVSDSQWQQQMAYQKQADANDLAYKYAALNKSSSGSSSGSSSKTTESFNPSKYKYTNYLDDYIEAIQSNGLTDADAMIQDWYERKYITAQEWADMRKYALKNVLPNMKK